MLMRQTNTRRVGLKFFIFLSHHYKTNNSLPRCCCDSIYLPDKVAGTSIGLNYCLEPGSCACTEVLPCFKYVHSIQESVFFFFCFSFLFVCFYEDDAFSV